VTPTIFVFRPIADLSPWPLHSQRDSLLVELSASFLGVEKLFSLCANIFSSCWKRFKIVRRDYSADIWIVRSLLFRVVQSPFRLYPFTLRV